MASNPSTFRATTGRAFRRILPWALALAVATCTDDQNGPSAGGTGYFSFRPVYGISNSLSQFGIVADSIHVKLTRPVDQIVLDTTVFFPPDSTSLRLALPVQLEQSPETLAAVIEIKAGATILFVDSVDVKVVDGPPSPADIPTVLLDYVGPGKNVASITLAPGDTTIVLGDTLFFAASAVDSSNAPVASFFTAWKTSDTTVARINAAGRLIAPNLRGSVRVIGYTPTGIADTSLVTFAPVPVVITADSGNTQSGLAGDSLGALFVARVKGADSLGISGIAVRFAAVTAGGAVRDTFTLITDANGRVRTRGVLGTTAGAYSYTATVVGTAITRTFSATATAGAASAIAIQGGNAQTDTAGRALPLPLTVRVADAFNNPVAGAKVYWTRPVGTGVRSADSSFTDAAGLASITYTLGAVGLDSVRAALAATSAFVDFSATAINGAPASVSKVFGDAQTDTVGRLLIDSLAVIVRNAGNQPVVGTPVVWTVLRGGTTSDDTVFTDGNGRAAVAYTLGTTTGTDSVRAQAGAASAVFTETALTGLATTLSLVSGDAQTDTAGYALPLPFVVHAADAFGNAVAGTAILFTRTAGTGTLADDTVATDLAGNASVGYTLGTVGGDTVTAQLLCGCSTVTFSATAVPAAPASIVTVQGDSQTVTVNTTADTFAVLVRDAASNPIAGVKVDWAFIPAQGSFTPLLPAGVLSSYTDSLGVARGIYTAGTQAGTVRVEAQIGSLIDSLFVFPVAAAPSAIVIQSGDLQTDTIYRTIGLPFVARVTDAFGNPVTGAIVAYSVVSGSGSLFGDSIPTNALGDAAVGYLHGGVPGVDTIRATLAGTGAFVDFQTIAVPGAPASFSAASGDGQTDTVLATLATPVSIEVLDAQGHPVPGAVVTFTGQGGLTGLPAVDTADLAGLVSTTVTLGDTAGTWAFTASTAGGTITAPFVLTATPGAPALIVKTGGDAQSDTAGTTLPVPFTVHATDAYGNDVGGAQVAFARLAGSGAVGLDTATTDVAGAAATSYTLGAIPGTDTVRAQLVANGASVLFTASTVPATPGSIVAVAGDGQTGVVGLPLTDSIAVRVYNGGAVPIAGTGVVWSVIRGGTLDVDTVLTDANGFAVAHYTMGTLSGTDSVQATTLTGGLSATFTFGAQPDAPAQLSLVGGNAQTDTIGRTLGVPLTVFVGDQYGNAVVGAAVTWTRISGTGTVSPDTAVTNAVGHALASYTLGGVPGVDSIRAALVGTSATLDFTATAVSGAAAGLVKLLGDNQADTVLSTLTDSLIVQLQDAGSAPVANTWLYWTTAGMTLSADSTLTDLNGRAAVQVTFGATAVPAVVVVHNVDTTVATVFNLRMKAGTATQITSVAGLGQSGVVNTALPIDFGVFVQDAYGNHADSGVAVTWTNLAGFATAGLPDTTVTDSTGVAYLVDPLLGPIVGEDSLQAGLVGQPATALFTATATAGAAGSLLYVSGTGQADTVGQVLPLDFVVVVRDSAGNAVAGSWVQWAIVAGNGSLSADSSQTDGTGAAKVSLTLGTTAGVDSVVASVAGVGNTVTFYTQAVPDAPFDILTFQGDGQSGAVNTALPGFLAARVLDQYGNPLEGLTVDYAVVGGFGVNFVAPFSTTDSAGVAPTGTVTLDSIAGSYTVAATLAELPADTAFFTVVALPIGTSAVWTGAVSTNYGVAGNWSPAAVPSSAANIFIPAAAANQPALVGPVSVGGVELESGATLTLGAQTLTVLGNAKLLGTVSRTTGAIALNASTGTVEGTVPYLVISATAGTIDLSGATTVTDSVRQLGGTFRMNGKTLTVGGALSVLGGAFEMLNGADSVDVGGAALFNGVTTTGHLTSGTLVVRGGLAASLSSGSFMPSGTHRTVLAGAAPQGISFPNTTGAASNRFNDVVFANAAGVTFSTNAYVAGTADVQAGTVSGAGRTITIAGTLLDPTSVAWTPTNTILAGSPASLPDSFVTNLTFNGTVALAHDVVFKGTATLGGVGATTLNGFTLRADSTLVITGSHQLVMQDPADTLEAMQSVSWSGSTTAGLLTAGVVIAHADFDASLSSGSYLPTGTHRTEFVGTTAQTISFPNTSSAVSNRFNDVVFANPAGIVLANNTYITDTVDIQAGAVTSAAGRTVTLGGTLLDPTSLAWLPTNTVYTGAPASLPDSFRTNVTFNGTVTLAHDLVFNGTAVLGGGGVTTINGFTLRADSTLVINGTHQVVMQNAADTVETMQAVNWDGSTTAGLLTAGVVRAHGNFAATLSSGSYLPTGTHRTEFVGTAAQTISFPNTSSAVSNRFNDVAFANPAGVTFATNAYITDTADVQAGTVAGAGRTITLGGTLLDPTSAGWLPTTTIFAALPASLPDTLNGNVTFNGSVALAKPLVVKGTFTTGGVGAFALNGFWLRADSSFTVGGSNQFLMQNAADSLDVKGAIVWNGATTPGMLTAGILVVRGDLTAGLGSATFQPSGSHRTRFTSGIHTVSFPNNRSFTGNRFQDLEVTNPSNITTATDLYVAGTFRNIAGPTGSLIGSGTQRLFTRGLAVGNWNFDGIRVDYSGPASFQLDNATFVNQDPTLVQLTIRTAGGPAVTLNSPTFATVPTSGKLVAVTDTLANGSPAVVWMQHAAPLDGSAFETEVAGNDGAQVDWSSLVFATQPVYGTSGDTLAGVRVAVLNPAGDTASFFTDSITLALGANPGSATLGGTLTQAASGGIATFGDLSLSSGGIGYTLVASAPGLGTVTSAAFDQTLPLPAGFTTQWTGAVSADWYDAGNWSGGVVPDSTTNVYISTIAPTSPQASGGSAYVNRIRIDSGTTLDLNSAYLIADSSVEATGGITGAGNVEFTGNGDLSGSILANVNVHSGPYQVVGHLDIGLNFAILDSGLVTLAGADTLAVTGNLATNQDGRFAMTDAAALVDVGADLNFYGGSTTGELTLGTLRIVGNVTSGGERGDAFAPSGGHLTVLSGSGLQVVNFPNADSTYGSHFGRLQVSTAGTAFMLGRYNAMGDLLITSGATLADSLRAGFEAHGFTTVDAGGTLAVNSFRTRGGLGVAAGATYAVATTTYYGGTGFPINPAPYDTLVLALGGQATGDLTVIGDLRIDGSAGGADFDLNGHTVTVNGSVGLSGNATLTMQDAADQLNVAGDFFTNGASTEGRLTDGLLVIGGNFRQAADGSTGAFRASPGHTTRITGGNGLHLVDFDSPALGVGDSSGSKFGRIEFQNGTDSLRSSVMGDRIVAAAAEVTYDDQSTSVGITVVDTIDIQSGAQLKATQLDLYGGILYAGAAYDVGTTRFFGGTEFPALPYTSVLIAGPSLTQTGDATVGLHLTIGLNGEVGGSPGELVVNGHQLYVGGQLATGGYGLLTMASGDSVTVVGTLNFNGGNEAGHLTGGTLVGLGHFSAGNHSGDSSFVAGPAHKTVLMATGPTNLYSNAASAAGLRFGKLFILDDGTRTVSAFGRPFTVADSLVIGSSTASFTGAYSTLRTEGAVLSVTGSQLGISDVYFTAVPSILGAYSVSNTHFIGTAQAIPDLPYMNVYVDGTAYLTAPLTLPALNQITIGQDGGASDLALNGFHATADYLTVSGIGTLTMTQPGDSLTVGVASSFDGGSEAGRLTNGVLTLRGTFTQGSTTSDSSFHASGAHLTVFADSTTSVAATVATMNDGRSRFNEVAITGRGVNFAGTTWIDGNASIVSPTIDSVGGGWVAIGGSLTDQYHRWLADTTEFLGVNPLLPDSIAGTVAFSGTDTLTDPVVLGGSAILYGTVVGNGQPFTAHGDLLVDGGRLEMQSGADQVTVFGTATFQGGNEANAFTAGRLTLFGNVVRDSINESFMAGGTHRTILAGSSTQTLSFAGNPYGGGYAGFQDLVTYNASIDIDRGLLVLGTFRDSVTSGTLFVDATANPAGTYLSTGQTEATNVQFSEVLLAMGDQSQLDTATFSFASATGNQQLAIHGPGRPTPLDLHAITFSNWADAGTTLVIVSDDNVDGQSIHVRMFGTTPFDGSSLSAVNSPSGDAGSTVTWSRLALQSFPLSVDSLVPFGFSVGVQEPDSSFRSDVIGTVTASLGANPNGATLGGTTSATFDGALANYFNLTLDRSGSGTTLHFEMQGRAIDSLTTGPLEVLNLMPSGAVVFDGGASDGLWSSALNWSGDLVPSPTDSVFIPGGASVTYVGTDTIGTLVLGRGASLNIASGTLVSTGNVVAGQTIIGSGTLEVAGAASLVSGTLPSLHVTGSVTAAGPTSIAGDLIIDGATAEFNVGGQKVDVSNTLFTQNGGLLTMDGAADTLYVASTSWAGGDETGRLTDGVLVIQGSNFDQGFGDPKSFYASGNHTTIFGDGGSSTAVNITAPGSSQFAHVKVQNPNGVDFNESGLGFVRMAGDLALSAGGSVTGDTLKVDGTFTSDGSTSVSLGTLILGASPTLAGTFTVGTTWFTGSPYVIPAAPQGYQHLYMDNDVTLGESVTAQRVTITGTGTLDVNGHALTADTLWTQASGELVMNGATDSVFVTQAANLLGGDQLGNLSAGVLTLGGNLNAQSGQGMRASGTHKTRFVGPGVHFAVVSPYCEGLCAPQPTATFNDLEIAADTVVLSDLGRAGTNVSGVLHTDGGQLMATGSEQWIAATNVLIDTLGGATINRLKVLQTLDFRGTDSAQFRVDTTEYIVDGATVRRAPYALLLVNADVALDTALAAWDVSLENNGSLTLAGHRLDVGHDFEVDGSAHLLMQNAADTLWVDGRARFAGEDATGDLTAGVVRARSFYQTPGTSSSPNGFVQTGSGKVVMVGMDSLQMYTNGPLGSRIRMLDLTLATDTVFFEDAWISDSLLATDPAITGFTKDEAQSSLVVLGTAIWADGRLELGSLAVGGSLSVGAGATYAVGLTKFIGDGMAIPSNVTYTDVEVQYHAYLTGDLDLTGNAGDLLVANFGNLDLNGHSLRAVDFSTDGYGRLTMHSDLDTLVANTAAFGGESTDTTLTAGTIITASLSQTVGASGSANAYAPSGTHRLVLDDLGNGGDGVSASFASPGVDSSHINRLTATDYGVLMPTPIVGIDTMFFDVALNGGVGHSVYAYGPILFGPSATVTLDSLFVFDTLVVDPSGTFSVTTTIFGPVAAPAPPALPYTNVIIWGDQTLSAAITLSGDLTIDSTGVLTVNGQAVSLAGTFHTKNGGRLVMTDPADTLQAYAAIFDGPASGTDLSAGLIRVNGYLSQISNNSIASFRSTGTAVEFYGGGNKYTTFDNADSSASRFADVRVKDNSFLRVQSASVTMGRLTVESGSEFDGGYQPFQAAHDFYGKVELQSGARMADSLLGLVTFHDSLLLDPAATYAVVNTGFRNTNHLPDVLYGYLYLMDGTHDTLTHDLNLSYTLVTHATADGNQDLVLNGHTVHAYGVNTQGHGRFDMTNPLDTIYAAGDVTFGGGDMSNRLTAGEIQFWGGGLAQDSSNSVNSLRVDGTRFFFGGYSDVTHAISFQSPGNNRSYLGEVYVGDGDALDVNSTLFVTGPYEQEFGTYFTLNAGPYTAEFFGPVTLGDGASFHAADGTTNVNFYSTVTRSGFPPSYDVANTGFVGTNSLPDLPYKNLFLYDGTHDTLTTNLSVSGLLSLYSTSAGAQDLVLNGYTITADSIQTSGSGRLTMTNALDSLIVWKATFGGSDLSGRLTDGAIVINGDFTQDGTTSDKSFRVEGTHVRFPYNGSSHPVTFANPDSSWFGDVDAGPLGGGFLMLTLNSDMKAGYVADAATLIVGPTHRVTVDSVKALLGTFQVDVARLTTKALAHTGPLFYTVPYTEFNGGLQVPGGFGFDTLAITNGGSFVGAEVVTAQTVIVNYGTFEIQNGGELHATGNVVVTGPPAWLKIDGGGTLTVDGTFSTQNGGVLISLDPLSGMSAGNVSFQGGSQANLLTAGGMDVRGSLTSADATFFADSLYQVNFTGGGNHTFAVGATHTVGYLSIGAESTDSDTLSLAQSTTAYRFGATGGARILKAGGTYVQAERFTVNDATFDGVSAVAITFSPQPAQFDNVTFTGFGATDIQFGFRHPGQASPFVFNNIDFDNVADGVTGFGITALDTDGGNGYNLSIELANSLDNGFTNLLDATAPASIIFTVP